MSHADKYTDNLDLKHDAASKLPSKSSQPPPIAMAKAGIFDYDSRVYLFKKYRTQWASCPAAMISVLAGSPLENIKTRMQSRDFRNSWECMKFIKANEGIRGFWAGTMAPLASLTITRVAGFSVYQNAKYALDTLIEDTTGKSPLKLVNTPGTFPDWSVVTCFTTAGAISGAACTFLVTPFELIKNATQTSVLMASNTQPRGPSISSVAPEKISRVSSLGAYKQIIRRHGFLGLYTGFRLHMMRDTFGSAIYFGVYETSKQTLTAYFGADRPNHLLIIGLSGWLCGIMSWVMTYPLDTMKTRAQSKLVGDPARCAKLLIEEGSKTIERSSKWKGLEMMIARSSVQNMIQMIIFEQAKIIINGLEFSDGEKELPEKRKKLHQQKTEGPPVI